MTEAASDEMAHELLTPADLTCRVERICDLVSSHLDLLTRGDDTHAIAKATCEIALFAAYLRGEPACRDRFGAWGASTLRSIEKLMRGTPALMRILWTPGRAATYGMGHGLLNRAGIPCPPLDDIVRTAASHPLASSRETSPYEALEAGWSLGLSGGAQGPPPAGLATDRPVHPLFMAEDDAYAYTHTILYATDLGRRPLPAHLAADAADVCDAGASWSLARADFDLFGEFAISTLFAGTGPTPALRLGLNAWAISWDDLGCVPDRALAGLKPESRSRADVFFAIYHANLVAGLLAASLLARPGWLEAEDRAPAPSSRLLAALASRTSTPAIPSAEGGAGYSRTVAKESEAGDVAGLLVEIFGSRVGGALNATTPASALRASFADLTIHRGMRDRDFEHVCRGASFGLDATCPSSTTLVAADWISLFARSLDALGLDGPGQYTDRAASIAERARRARAMHLAGNDRVRS